MDRERASALLGKRVRVLLSHEVVALPDDGSGIPNFGFDYDRPVIVEGLFLGFGQGGDFEVLESDGCVHYCWPLLDIEEIT